MTDEYDTPQTEAFLVLTSFNALTKGQTIHLPVPLDEYNQSLLAMGLIASVDQAVDLASVVASNSDGEVTTVLGVMSPIASPRRTRRPRSTVEQRVAEMEARTDGEADS